MRVLDTRHGSAYFLAARFRRRATRDAPQETMRHPHGDAAESMLLVRPPGISKPASGSVMGR
jgi:hypothetical protein